MAKQRTLIIGLDGATFDLIQPMVAAGDLPNLSSLMQRGVCGELQTWPNTNSAAAWSSMVTGFNSGEHGIYHFSDEIHRHDAGTGWKPVTAGNRRREPFWRILNAAGQRAGIINIPITYPADALDGFMLAGMDTPSLQSAGFAYPQDLPEKLRQQGIDYIIDAPNLGSALRRNPHELPDIVRQMIAARAQTILHLMQTEKWDVLMAVFIATDRVQHYFWPRDLLDIDAPDWQPIRQVYRQIDEFFGKALSLVDEDTNLLVVSDHGFGPTLPAKRYLQQLFAELGLLRMKRSGGGNVKGRTLKSLLKSGRKILPYALQTRLARALPALHLQAVNAHGKATMDWPATKVFTSASGGRVWINLKGRSEEGSVSIDDYEALRQQVCEILLKITDSATGRSAIRAVHKREDLYHGEFLEKAPDLVLEWDYEVFSQGLVYQDGEHSIVVKPEKGNQRGNHWSGNHRPLGIFIACGKHIKQGATLTGANIYDIAPTLLYLQDVAISRDSDGKVLTEIFADERLTAQPLRWREEASLSTQPPAKPINEEEARQIEERLRGLGYIE